MPQLSVVVKIMFLLYGTYAKPQNVISCKHIKKLLHAIYFLFIYFCRMYGEVQKQNCLLVDTSILDPTPTIPVKVNPFVKCCYTQDVFADLTDTDPFKNDNTAFLDILPISIASVTMRLQKFVNNAWANQTTLTNNSFGTFYAYGFHQVDNLKYVGYYLNWRSVLLAYGVGKYRVQFDLTSTQRNSPEYCLRLFDIDAVDETTRITWVNNSIIGDKNQTRTKNFVGIKWLQQIRIKHSMFGMKRGNFEVERQRWQNGYERSHKKTYAEQYTLEIRKMPIDIIDLICYELLMGDDIFITDYNSINNSGKYINHSVEISGEFAPNYSNNNPMPSVILTFNDRFSNRTKFYS